jgi:hypothetical protein
MDASSSKQEKREKRTAPNHKPQKKRDSEPFVPLSLGEAALYNTIGKYMRPVSYAPVEPEFVESDGAESDVTIERPQPHSGMISITADAGPVDQVAVEEQRVRLPADDGGPVAQVDVEEQMEGHAAGSKTIPDYPTDTRIGDGVMCSMCPRGPYRTWIALYMHHFCSRLHRSTSVDMADTHLAKMRDEEVKTKRMKRKSDQVPTAQTLPKGSPQPQPDGNMQWAMKQCWVRTDATGAVIMPLVVAPVVWNTGEQPPAPPPGDIQGNASGSSSSGMGADGAASAGKSG